MKSIKAGNYTPITDRQADYLDTFFKVLSSDGKVNISRSRDAHTAYWDPEMNNIVLPEYAKNQKELYILFGSHEIAHSLYTPKNFYQYSNNSKVISSVDNNKTVELTRTVMHVLNVIEDIRIEKLIRRKYPGLVSIYRKGHELLYQKAVSENKNYPISNEDWAKRTIIDRISAKVVYGKIIDLELSDNEYAIMKWICRAETWNDTLIRTFYILELLNSESSQIELKSNQSESGESNDFSDSDFPNDFSDSDFPNDSKEDITDIVSDDKSLNSQMDLSENIKEFSSKIQSMSDDIDKLSELVEQLKENNIDNSDQEFIKPQDNHNQLTDTSKPAYDRYNTRLLRINTSKIKQLVAGKLKAW